MSINEHRNWKWFLRIVKEEEIDLYNRLMNEIYTITEREKGNLTQIFDPQSGLTYILNSLEVIKA